MQIWYDTLWGGIFRKMVIGPVALNVIQISMVSPQHLTSVVEIIPEARSSRPMKPHVLSVTQMIRNGYSQEDLSTILLCDSQKEVKAFQLTF